MLKQKVLKIYQNRCVVSHFNVYECDLAHIIPQAISSIHQYNPNNCLLLSSSLHRTFDKFLWTFDVFSVEESKKGWCKLDIILSNRIVHKRSMITGYSSCRVELPIGTLQFLYCHYRVFFNMNYTSYNKDHTVKQMYDYYQKDTLFKSPSLTNFKKETGKYIAIVDHSNDFSKLLLVWEGASYADRTWHYKSNIIDKDDLSMYIKLIEELDDPNY